MSSKDWVKRSVALAKTLIKNDTNPKNVTELESILIKSYDKNPNTVLAILLFLKLEQHILFSNLQEKLFNPKWYSLKKEEQDKILYISNDMFTQLNDLD
jgi:hypothetical protein